MTLVGLLATMLLPPIMQPPLPSPPPHPLGRGWTSLPFSFKQKALYHLKFHTLKKHIFCRDKSMLVATNIILSRQIFVITKCLSRQKYFVATNIILSHQKFCRHRHMFVMTELLWLCQTVTDLSSTEVWCRDCDRLTFHRGVMQRLWQTYLPQRCDAETVTDLPSTEVWCRDCDRLIFHGGVMQRPWQTYLPQRCDAGGSLTWWLFCPHTDWSPPEKALQAEAEIRLFHFLVAGRARRITCPCQVPATPACMTVSALAYFPWCSDGSAHPHPAGHNIAAAFGEAARWLRRKMSGTLVLP